MEESEESRKRSLRKIGRASLNILKRSISPLSAGLITYLFEKTGIPDKIEYITEESYKLWKAKPNKDELKSWFKDHSQKELEQLLKKHNLDGSIINEYLNARKDVYKFSTLIDYINKDTGKESYKLFEKVNSTIQKKYNQSEEGLEKKIWGGVRSLYKSYETISKNIISLFSEKSNIDYLPPNLRKDFYDDLQNAKLTLAIVDNQIYTSLKKGDTKKAQEYMSLFVNLDKEVRDVRSTLKKVTFENDPDIPYLKQQLPTLESTIALTQKEVMNIPWYVSKSGLICDSAVFLISLYLIYTKIEAPMRRTANKIGSLYKGIINTFKRIKNKKYK